METIAVRLKREGYRTYMTGKWHLGRGPGDLPNDHGFDRSFALDASGADNWTTGPTCPCTRKRPGSRTACLPIYLTISTPAFLVDRMIDYLGDAPGARTHRSSPTSLSRPSIFRLQAPEAFIEHYDGAYDIGWHEVRRAAPWARAIELGLIPEGAPLGDMHPALRDWASLDAAERAIATRSMEVNAGMLEAMDFHIGRLIGYLKQRAPTRTRSSWSPPTMGRKAANCDTGENAILDVWLARRATPKRASSSSAAPTPWSPSARSGRAQPPPRAPLQVSRRRRRAARAADHVWTGTPEGARIGRARSCRTSCPRFSRSSAPIPPHRMHVR